MLSFKPELSWAVLIGASKFPRDAENLPPLPAVRSNVADLERILCNAELVGFLRSHIVTMIDIDEPATIAERLAETAKQATDTLLVYYAGHGLIGNNNELRLATSNTKYSVADYSTLSIETVRQALRESRAESRILILDCCFSGRAFEIMSPEHELLKASIDVRGTYGLASASATRPAIAPEGARYTAFTGELINVLEKGIEGAAGELSLEQIYQQVRSALIRNGFPEPQRANFAAADRFYLAVNRHLQPDVLERLRSLEESVRRFEEQFASLLSARDQQEAERQDQRISRGKVSFPPGNPNLLGPQFIIGFSFAAAPACSDYILSHYTKITWTGFDLASLALSVPLLLVLLISIAALSNQSTGSMYFRVIFGQFLSPVTMFWSSLLGFLALAIIFITILLSVPQ
jgi:hypothetical protein